jgi:hypothetical protein
MRERFWPIRVFGLHEEMSARTFYYNWRCARHGSNRPDLIDDMFHVLNATYCDVYVSKEKNSWSTRDCC